MLKVRVLAALVFAPAILAAIVCGGQTLRCVCFVIVQVLLWEYQRMVLSPRDVGLKATGHLGAAMATLAVWQALPGPWAELLVPLMPLVALLVVLTCPQPIATSMQRAALMLLGVLWSGGLLPYLVRLRERPDDGLALALMGLFCCWAGDTGAYFAGRAFGKRPLYPQVSPKKTLEGGAGGIAAAVTMALALRYVLAVPLDAGHIAALGALGALAGILGDLCESLLKRSVGAKDSSHLIPGHGGFFDRFDGVVFAVPAVYIYVTLFVGAAAPL